MVSFFICIKSQPNQSSWASPADTWLSDPTTALLDQKQLVINLMIRAQLRVHSLLTFLYDLHCAAVSHKSHKEGLNYMYTQNPNASSVFIVNIFIIFASTCYFLSVYSGFRWSRRLLISYNPIPICTYAD